MRRRWPRPSNEISRSASFRAPLLSTRAMPATCRKKALGFERGHAAGASCGDCLTIDFVHNVATREHAQYAGSRRARYHLDVAVTIEGKFSCEQLRSEEHTSELQSLMPNSYAVFCLKK